MSSTRQTEQIREFMAITNATRSTAEKFLKENRWSLDYAINDLYNRRENFTNQDHGYDEQLVATYYHYASKNGTMDSEALIRYVNNLGYQLEDPVTICLAHLLHVENLTADINEDQFLSRWDSLRCNNIEQMQRYMDSMEQQLHQDPRYFQTIYSYTFELALEGDDRQLSIETAIAYWKLLFINNSYASTIPYGRLHSWFQFLHEQTEFTSISKDTWEMFLPFALKFPNDRELLAGYNVMESWPIAIDEYWEWLKLTQ
ncbi:HBR068Cp [Eremothecium sinecaudum]|uniref:Defective in cullin neddylation protein n=1 Tax=Eremothecium sinecaudum TaxID=45286 RepID=A0A109UWT6_9SACH|nr:HBR068Cp [Eremothecium sinecaudum]AMD18969.1 HBR068Cp [Eremothecium sinecaudum]